MKNNSKMKIKYFGVNKAQYGWTTEVEIVVKTKRQFTKEHHTFKCWGSNLLVAIVKGVWYAHTEAKRLQSLPGEFN
jgi:hypothetical protein